MINAWVFDDRDSVVRNVNVLVDLCYDDQCVGGYFYRAVRRGNGVEIRRGGGRDCAWCVRGDG
jgi:hypothetical protein